MPQPPPLDQSQKQAKAAAEIVKNNQNGGYQIDDMCEAIEEMKEDPRHSSVNNLRMNVSLDDETL